jgi:hypothetical protein
VSRTRAPLGDGAGAGAGAGAGGRARTHQLFTLCCITQTQSRRAPHTAHRTSHRTPHTACYTTLVLHKTTALPSSVAER